MASTSKLTRKVPGTPYQLEATSNGINCAIYKGELSDNHKIAEVALSEYFVFESDDIDIPFQLHQAVIDGIRALARDYNKSRSLQ